MTARDTCKAKIPQPKPVRGSWQIDTKPLDSRVRFAEPGKGYEAVSAAVVAITDADGSAIHAQLICAAPNRVASVNRFEAADVLLAAIARYGCPKVVFIDEGNEYNHRLISTIGRILGFQVKAVGGHNPTAKAMVEHLNLMIRKGAGEQYAGATTHTGFGDQALYGGSRQDSPSSERVAEDLVALVDERRPSDYGLDTVPNRHLAIAVREVHDTFLEMAPDDRRRRTLPATEKRHDTTVHLDGICFNGRNYHNFDDSPEPEMKMSPAERLVRMRNKNGPKTVTTLPYPGDDDRRIAYQVKTGQRLKYLAVVQDVKTIPLKDKAAAARHHRQDVRYGQQLQMLAHKRAAEDNDEHDLTTGRLGLVGPTTPASSLRNRLANQLGVEESNSDYTEDDVMIDGQLTPIAVFQVHREPPRYPHLNEIPQPTFEDWAIARPNRLLRIKTPTWMRTEGADGYRFICRVPKM